MPPMRQHVSTKTTKLLCVGDPGSGKTGALVSLARAGYNLRIIDLDNGLDVLRNLAEDAGPEVLDRIIYETITDPMKKVGGKLLPAKASVWGRVVDILSGWKFPERELEGQKIEAYDLGPVHTWTSQDVLVIDSLSFLANAAMNFILAMNGRLGGRAEQNDWYQGQQLLEGICQTLYDDGVKCNVIINAHISYIETQGATQGYPATLGKALSPKIGRYFNNVLMMRTKGSGANQSRKILTGTTGLVELKNSAPMRVKPEYPLASGLADYFRDVQGAQPSG